MRTCFECKYLDRSRKLNSRETHSKRYGCNSRCEGYICGWIIREKELSEMGCSYFEERKENEQLSLFECSDFGGCGCFME